MRWLGFCWLLLSRRWWWRWRLGGWGQVELGGWAVGIELLRKRGSEGMFGEGLGEGTAMEVRIGGGGAIS